MQRCCDVLRYIAPRRPADPTTWSCSPPASTTRPISSTRFLARQMGVELVEGRDLVVDQTPRLHADHRAGSSAVDVIYRRDRRRLPRPALLPARQHAGRARAGERLPRGQRGAGQRHRHRHRRRQGHLSLRPGHDPLLPRAGPDPAQRRDLSGRWCRRTCSHILANLDKLVVKAVNESGGYGMLIGPASTAEQRDEFAAKIRGQSARLHRPADDPAVSSIRRLSTAA